MSNHIKNDLKMSTTTLDPVELLLNKADQGNLIIKNPNVLRHDYIPSRILHRDKHYYHYTKNQFHQTFWFTVNQVQGKHLL